MDMAAHTELKLSYLYWMDRIVISEGNLDYFLTRSM